MGGNAQKFPPASNTMLGLDNPAQTPYSIGKHHENRSLRAAATRAPCWPPFSNPTQFLPLFRDSAQMMLPACDLPQSTSSFTEVFTHGCPTFPGASEPLVTFVKHFANTRSFVCILAFNPHTLPYECFVIFILQMKDAEKLSNLPKDI